MSLLSDKVLLVSGGLRGVGAGIVRAAAGEGATVAFTGPVDCVVNSAGLTPAG